jgi:hypothetical protein
VVESQPRENSSLDPISQKPKKGLQHLPSKHESQVQALVSSKKKKKKLRIFRHLIWYYGEYKMPRFNEENIFEE